MSKMTQISTDCDEQMDQDVERITTVTNTSELQNSLWVGKFCRPPFGFTFVQYIDFILLHMGRDFVREGVRAMMAQVSSSIGENITDFQMELNYLQVFANKYNLLLSILIFDQDRKETKTINGATDSREQPRCTFIVLGKDRRHYFPLSIMNKNNRECTLFDRNDDYLSARWKEFIQCFNQSEFMNSEQVSILASNNIDSSVFNTEKTFADGMKMQDPVGEIVAAPEKLVMPVDSSIDSDMLLSDCSNDPILHTNISRKTEEIYEFCVRDVEKDGSCLFRSVGLALGMEEISNDDLRSAVIDQIHQSKELKDAIRNANPNVTCDQYCDRIKKSTTWGDEIEIRAMALLYKKIICVVDVTDDSGDISAAFYPYGVDLPNMTQCIYLHYIGKSHYDLLYLKKKDDTNYKETIFGREDTDIQELLRIYIQDEIKASNYDILRLDNCTNELNERRSNVNCTTNNLILSNSIPRKSLKRKREESRKSSNSTNNSTTTNVAYYRGNATPIEFRYKAPKIIIGPQEKQRGRQIKELLSACLQGAQGEKRRHKPMKLNIDEIPKDEEVYLGIEVLTHDNKPHPSKIILPMDTELDIPDNKVFSKNTANKLDYIKFNDKNLTCHFDPDTKCIYWKVDKPGSLDISIRMVKLYQSEDNGINKDLIRRKKLYLSKLAFWICKLENGDYVDISATTLSNTIQELSTKNETDEKNGESVTNEKQLPESISDERESFESNTDQFIIQKNIHTLNGSNWLNDEIINFYLALVARESGHDGYPRVYAFNSFFYEKLKKDKPEHSSWSRYMDTIDFFNYHIVLIPIHLENHWTLVTIDFSSHCISYYDSLGGKNDKCLDLIHNFVEHMYAMKKLQASWIVGYWKSVPQQKNTNDCGVFICQFAKYLARQWLINLTQEDMPRFRQQMINEIKSNKLIVQSPPLTIMPISCSM
ncbi:unnamed protein product [Adineta steineri]|uniref:Ubiquitin-like protease family profile domain-containing protein n=1 Tax=Adineta steineri TaxID=433720 RepID=A0A815I339_9BILA|nr:unnamed protein product [Adineta steineri]CAF3905548.1 unnamed protein product [Adineta steineri]